MKKILIILLFTTKIFSQVVSVNPTSTIQCGWPASMAIFTLASNAPPYTYSVQTPCSGSFVSTYSTNAIHIFTLNCAGVYTFTLKNSSVILGVFNHTVSADSSGTLEIFSEQDSLCPLEFLGLGVTLAEMNKYGGYNSLYNINWNTGSTVDVIIISQTITTTYSVTALLSTSANTCAMAGTKTIFSNKCYEDITYIPESDNSGRIKIYPNPISSHITISRNQKEQLSKLTLLNALGQNVLSLNNIKESQDMDLSFLASGVYYLKLELISSSGNKDQKVFKIVKD